MLSAQAEVKGSESCPPAENKSMLSSQLRGSSFHSHGAITKRQARNHTWEILCCSRMGRTKGPGAREG